MLLEGEGPPGHLAASGLHSGQSVVSLVSLTTDVSGFDLPCGSLLQGGAKEQGRGFFRDLCCGFTSFPKISSDLFRCVFPKDSVHLHRRRMFPQMQSYPTLRPGPASARVPEQDPLHRCNALSCPAPPFALNLEQFLRFLDNLEIWGNISQS